MNSEQHPEKRQHVDASSHVRPRPLTMGVEEEFMLVAPDNGAPVSRATAVVAHATSAGQTAGAFHSELLATMVESTTGICTDLAQVRRQLVDARRTLAQAAAQEGAQLRAAGIPAHSAPPRPVTNTAHYHRMQALYGLLVTETETCGCHVHIGSLDMHTAVAVVNYLRPWLPTLLTLSADSASDNALATGYASWRTIALSRWPTVQIPPHFTSADHYHDMLALLQRSEVLPPGSNAYWLARPSLHVPTVEIRVADVATIDHAVLQAGLSRALVHAALQAHSDGRPAPTFSDHQAAAALWMAARYGLAGPALHPNTGQELPATILARELLTQLRPALHTTGDLDEVEELITHSLAPPQRAPRTHPAHNDDTLDQDPSTAVNPGLRPDPPPLRR